jgi:hypothetical protein
MKLYCTVNSERGKETRKGGNSFIQANFTIDKTHALSITLKVAPLGVEIWDTWQAKMPVLITTIRDKR